MKLSRKEFKALDDLLANYTETAIQEFKGSSSPYHVYRTLRVIALKVWGKPRVERMERAYRLAPELIEELNKEALPHREE